MQHPWRRPPRHKMVVCAGLHRRAGIARWGPERALQAIHRRLVTIWNAECDEKGEDLCSLAIAPRDEPMPRRDRKGAFFGGRSAVGCLRWPAGLLRWRGARSASCSPVHAGCRARCEPVAPRASLVRAGCGNAATRTRTHCTAGSGGGTGGCEAGKPGGGGGMVTAGEGILCACFQGDAG